VGRCPAAHTCMTVYAWPHNLDSYVARTRKSIPRSPALSGPISLWPLPRPSDRPRLVNRCLMRRAGAGRRVTAGHHRPREAGTAARRRLASPAGLPPDKGEAFADAPARTVPPQFPQWPSSWWSMSRRFLTPGLSASGTPARTERRIW